MVLGRAFVNGEYAELMEFSEDEFITGGGEDDEKED
jgi:hypothetical protein